ncbi:S6 family peptidase [Moraxella sp. ZY210820]|uniref:S6 family peptidase n=1 Tax=unclassified Moraxella TaxID=2685852 RepID=UPI00272EF5F4|nr:S6 family peptidase [Moraxella sp. ZY210820]WLF83835.1 autotransporter outer membrane beta-barrel domain-containing protein [Moraxella sp. ZY210820]
MKLTKLKKTLLAVALSSILMTYVQASTVREDIDYQTYRDFAENKGVFVVGATNIEIKDKTGKSLGSLFQDNIPMPDLSASLVNTGTATLIDPQFIVTAMHNGEDTFQQSTRPIQFGNQYGYRYNIVDINYAEDLTTAEVDDESDIHGKYKDLGAPRLNKLVTEVVPQSYLDQNNVIARGLDLSNYTAFARVGSGVQRVTNGAAEPELLNDAYDYLTGGSVMAFNPTVEKNSGGGQYIGSKAELIDVYDPNDKTFIGTNDQVYHFNDAMKTHFADGRPVSSSPLITMTEQGDSGSGLLGYNRNTNRWELIGVLHGGFEMSDKDGNPLASDTYAVFDRDVYDTIKGRYIGLDAMGRNLNWSMTGLDSSLVNGAISNRLEKGKDIYFSQDATVSLTQNIDQGSGAIKVGYQPIANMIISTPAKTVTFRGDNTSNRTWLGAGLDINTGSTVNWQLHNPEDDRLSKIGGGTLNVNGKGENLGDISVGDGLVILAQQADAGKKQAFNNVEITSGRGTVRLTDNQQINLDNLTFGYRGGRLDLNGVQNLSTHSIHNVDDGGLIVNHNDQKASLVWLGEKQLPERVAFPFVNGTDGNAYRVKTSASLFYNPTRDNSLYYDYLGEGFNTGNTTKDDANAEKAHANYVNQINRVNLITTFAGHLGEKADSGKKNGQIDFTYRPEDRPSESTLLLTGGSNLNGQLIAEAGRVVMSGRPTPHALDYIAQKEVIKDDDWINRSYTASTIQAKNDAKVYIGRNVSEVNANIDASSTSKVQLGFIQNSTPVCVRSDYNFEESCDVKNYSTAVLNTLPTTQVKGDVNLANSAELEIGRSHLTGKIQAVAGTTTKIQADGKWTLTGNSQVGDLSLNQGAIVQLNNASNANGATSYNTLNILGNLTGNGQFNYLTNISKLVSDKVIVNGNNDANVKLLVQDTGLEPQKTKEHLTLLSVKGTDRGTVLLANNNQQVDLGAYRYTLQREGNDYRLWSPNLEQEIDNQANATAQAINDVRTQVNAVVGNAEQALANAQQVLQNAERDQLSVAAINNAKAEVAKAQQAVNDAKAAQAAANSATTVQGANNALATATTALGVTTAVVATVNTIVNDAKAKAKAEAEAKAKAEAEAKAKAEAEAKAKAEAEAKAKAEAEAKAKAEAEAKAKAEAEAKAKAEAEAKAKAEAEAKAKAEAEAKAKAEAEAKAKAEAEAKAKAEAEEEARRKALAQKQQSELISRYANTALSDLSSQVNSVIHVGDGLNHHLLDNIHSGGVWLNVNRYNETEHGSAYYRDYKKQETLTQIGADTVLDTADGQLLVGVAYSHSEGTNRFADNASSESKLDMLSVYSKLNYADNSFVSVDVGYGRTDSELRSEGEDTKLARNIATAGVNVGTTVSTKLVNIKPSVGVRYHYLEGRNYNLNGANIALPDANILSYRAGVSLEKSFSLGNGIELTPSISSHYVDTMNEKSEVKVNGHSLRQAYGRYGHHEVGVKVGGKQWSTEIHAGRSEGSEVNTQNSGGVKLNYHW